MATGHKQPGSPDGGMNLVRMGISLQIKKISEFFWLRGIRDVDITKCCAKCFIGESDTRFYHETIRRQTPKLLEYEIVSTGKFKAYYLCGLSESYNYDLNTHVAFVPETGSKVEIENDEIHLVITNARHIPFQHYRPNPEGEFTEKQRTCRNWIFANYLRDGQPL